MAAEFVLLLDTRDVAEAQAIMEGLPLAKTDFMDHEYIAVGPLSPLRLLMANPWTDAMTGREIERHRRLLNSKLTVYAAPSEANASAWPRGLEAE